ncbi:MAG: NADH:flavin oxidoreductase/NADH oxidase family protein [Deltaproteobacteria bacterium]|nr:MAG: NADH:flavin oxidoreductase/NADH oxidase family protein [Deltaproteobacteria bacterium]TNF27738.1 MAG: NADH:flavin oxidoreductase/NADH oxidase family protein [Deltaproteobacteria bacterium]
MEISKTLELPCGVVLPNRLAKSAMSENMALSGHIPGEEFRTLYERWGRGGTGLCITGNVMVDSRHLGEANNVVIEEQIANLEGLVNWAQAQESSNMHIWVQLNHPGKQTPKFLTVEPVAPSAIALNPPLDRMFNTPRALGENEIEDLIKRWGYAARIVKEAGFKGVQIHGAHGYLVSQFLSPHHNQRSDKWGGSPENRMRFVVEVYKSMRDNVGSDFPIGIKMNSADFSKGGFSHEEAIEVARTLSDLGIDLIEISGGSYEKPVMTGVKIKESTKKREAYFLEYAKDIKAVIKCPLMVTGGFRTAEFMNQALLDGELDLVGLGRPLCINPDFSKQLLAGEPVVSQVHPLTSGVKVLDKIFPLEIIWYTRQIQKMGKGEEPNPHAGVYSTILKSAWDTGIQGIRRVRAK